MSDTENPSQPSRVIKGSNFPTPMAMAPVEPSDDSEDDVSEDEEDD